MTKVIEIEGIGESYAAKLATAGVESVEKLLEKGATPKGREEVAGASGISLKLILKWVNHADLFRIKGVSGQYAELLEAAGVDTVVELAHRNAENLVNRAPTLSEVSKWIDEAKTLPRSVSY